jgi:hypothetical protein
MVGKVQIPSDQQFLDFCDTAYALQGSDLSQQWQKKP